MEKEEEPIEPDIRKGVTHGQNEPILVELNLDEANIP